MTCKDHSASSVDRCDVNVSNMARSQDQQQPAMDTLIIHQQSRYKSQVCTAKQPHTHHARIPHSFHKRILTISMIPFLLSSPLPPSIQSNKTSHLHPHPHPRHRLLRSQHAVKDALKTKRKKEKRIWTKCVRTRSRDFVIPPARGVPQKKQ